MPFNVLLGDLIGVILAPIFEAIIALFTPVFTVILELLVALMTPIVAPIFELFLWILVLISGTFFSLVWGLLTALGLARYASGISKTAYLLCATCLLYLLVGVFQIATSSPHDENLISQTGALIALALAGISLIVGVGTSHSPEERILRREKRLAKKHSMPKENRKRKDDPTQKGKGWSIFKAFVFGGVITAAFIWLWPKPEPELRNCTTTDRLRQLASEVMSERGSDPTADVISPTDCQ